MSFTQLDGSNGFRLFGGAGFTGFWVADAGDVNADGFADVIIGAPLADPDGRNNAGVSYVVFGTDSGIANLDLAALDGSNGFRLVGAAASDYSGWSVAGAGDVNGDGIDDLIVGAPNADPGGRTNAGESYVVFGTDAGFAADLDLGALDGTTGFRITGIGAGDGAGFSVESAGDFNGDGIDDLIVGAPLAVPGGAAFVVFGTSAGFSANFDLATLDGTNGFRIDAIAAGDNVGAGVAGAGDVNGDGIDDLVIGANGADPDGDSAAGEVYVVFGTTAVVPASIDLATLDGKNGFRIDGIDAFDQAGARVAAAGDVNGDGIADLIIGAPPANGGAGASFVVFGSDEDFGPSLDLASLDGTNGFRLDGIGARDRSGDSVRTAGDVNGDGFDDILIGAYGADPDGKFNAGETYLLFGAAGGFASSIDLATLDGTTGVRLAGVGSFDGSGSSASAAGDVNGDGIDDIIVGAYRNGGGYVLFGSTLLGGANDAPVAADDAVSTGTRGLVDLVADNGSGTDKDPDLDELTITAVDGIAVVAGDVVALASGLEVTFLGGSEVRLNGPGLALGSALATSFSYEISDGRGGSDAAVVTVEYLQDSIDLDDLDGANGFSIEDTGTSFFASFAGAGDINGDGIDDLIVGAYDYGAGRSYVVFGGAAGFGPNLDLAALDGTDGFRLDGIDAYDGSGRSVSGAGDINGDGIDDLIIAAPGADPGGNEYAGESYVVFGSAFGFAASTDLATLDGSNGFRIDGIDAYDTGFGNFIVGGAGDVNGDGIDDLIIGAAGGDPGGSESAGESYVVFGSDAGFAASVDLAALDGSNGFRLDGVDAYDYSGRSVAGAGDVNGDGIDDVIVGASGSDPGGKASAGASYVVFGSDAGFAASVDLSALDGSNGFRLDGVDAGDRSGLSVAAAGDVNGDGIGDVIVGASGSYANAAFVVFGSNAGFGASLDLAALDGSNGFRIDGAEPTDFVGTPVAGAGDVNGDGFDDLLIGAYGFEGYAGKAYVVYGSAAGFGPRVDLGALGASDGFGIVGSDDLTGFRVAGGGDVNGDGVSDLIVGNGADKGKVIFGFRTGETFMGTARADHIAGTALGDVITGLGRDDGLRGRAGNDLIDGGGGRDRLGGGADDDLIRGGTGADCLRGGAGDDTLDGGRGGDWSRGGAGDDVLVIRDAEALRDTFRGGSGTDRIQVAAESGVVVLSRLTARDIEEFSGAGKVVQGTGDGDRLDFSGFERVAGVAAIRGRGGDDWLTGSQGADRMEGGGGSDRIEGGLGDDWLAGGGATDRFVFAALFGNDTIADFDANGRGGQDRIDLRGLGITSAGFGAAVTISELGDDTLVEVAHFGTILFEGVTGSGANALGLDDFILLG
jgi:hypothetical protein